MVLVKDTVIIINVIPIAMIVVPVPLKEIDDETELFKRMTYRTMYKEYNKI